MVAVLREDPEQLELRYATSEVRPNLSLVADSSSATLASGLLGASQVTRMTFWRRRIVCLTALLLGLWVLSASFGSLFASQGIENPTALPTVMESAASESLNSGSSVIVKPGDTLWSIARQLQPAGDIRPLVDRIAKINNGHSLIAGQALLLP
ncbi:MAG: hypothetical protein CL428_07270 [Acidimicrobiaceae bacterium]|nr:hypothetical protein [Acidimicrobiaceae bacterium]